MKKYHACGNDCCLYYDNLEFAEECPSCGISRWKDQRRKILWKTLIYFPIIHHMAEMYSNLSNVMWHGRMVYDVSRSGPDRNICVRGTILWTLHDLASEKTLNQKLLNQRVR